MRETSVIPTRDLIGYGRSRPTDPWPGSKRLVVSVVVNYEEGSERSYAMEDSTQESSTEWNSYQLPDGVRNLAMESMYEYGSRVGVWRITDVLAEHNISATFFACAVALEQNRALAHELVRSNHCVVSHGYRWEEVFTMSEEVERERIELARESFIKTLGKAPRGWYCRYGPSVNTRRLITEAGFEYDCDAYNDDTPFFVPTPKGRHLVIPYTPDINDFRFWQSPGFVTGAQFFEYMKDSFDVLREEGRKGPRMMSVGLHPRQIGRPGRIAALSRFLEYARSFTDVEFLTRDEIADHWLTR